MDIELEALKNSVEEARQELATKAKQIIDELP